MIEDADRMWLSAEINREMEKRGWSQVDLAARAGVSQAAISKWKLGNGRIQIDQAIGLARALDRDVLGFVGHIWPALVEHVPEDLSETLARASDEQLEQITQHAVEVVGRQTTTRLRQRIIEKADHDQLRDGLRDAD